MAYKYEAHRSVESGDMQQEQASDVEEARRGGQDCDVIHVGGGCEEGTELGGPMQHPCTSFFYRVSIIRALALRL